jgi:NodT family efflux transporter outer membrane factor (OMF) lipoprotein
MRPLLIPSLLLAVVGLAGCAVGPDYHRPAALPAQPLPEKFSDSTPTNATIWKVAEPLAGQPRGPWWQLFGDAELNRLETLALTNNQSLAAAAATYEQARDLAAAARAGFYPQLTAGGTPNGDVTRQQTSANQELQGRLSGVSHTYNTFTAPIYLGWEMDLWGRVRRESEAAKAQFVASEEDFESARLAVAAEVAADYFSVLTLDEQFQLITNTIDSYQHSYDLTENLRRGGDASDLDVAQAATQLHTAQAQLPDIELRRAQMLHALAILCGQSPEGFDVGGGGPLPGVPGIPPGVPSVLLEHRPDVSAAERRMAAANAGVGVAKSAFFPTIRIDGLAGFQSYSASSWFDWSSRFWSVGPSLQLPLFTGGLNRANLAAAHAAYDAAVANYRSTVLNAFGEVADQLAAQRWLGEEWSAESAAAASAQKALEIANNRYRAGLVTYLDVVTEQTQALSVEQTAVQLKGDRLTAAVNLIKALGAGWQTGE